jgi:hypothetical protein
MPRIRTGTALLMYRRVMVRNGRFAGERIIPLFCPILASFSLVLGPDLRPFFFFFFLLFVFQYEAMAPACAETCTCLHTQNQQQSVRYRALPCPRDGPRHWVVRHGQGTCTPRSAQPVLNERHMGARKHETCGWCDALKFHPMSVVTLSFLYCE